MDASFWHDKWKNNEIGFHQHEANPLLVDNFKRLSLAKNSRVFLPLCGKTLDIAWLLAQGYCVVGCELSKLAIEQLFNDLGVTPTITTLNNGVRYSAKSIEVLVGNFFELSSQTLGPVDAIYDRAALVALPKDMRQQYSAHLLDITHSAPQLLLSYEYDQNLMTGPPFSVSNDEVKRHYMNNYTLSLLKSISVPGGLKGKCGATENVWLLTTR